MTWRCELCGIIKNEAVTPEDSIISVEAAKAVTELPPLHLAEQSCFP